MSHLHCSAAVLALTLMAGPSWAANCHIDPFSAPFGSEVQTRMVVRSGQYCGVTMHVGLQMRSVNAGGSNAMAISEQASHGVARTAGTQAWGYASTPGYVGKDRFVVESTGEIMGRYVIRGTSHYTVDVDVVR